MLLPSAILNWIILSLLYALFALGLNLVFGVLRILNFAQGVMYMLGGYVIYYCMLLFGFGYVLALILSFLLIGFLGVVVYLFFLRPFRGEILPALITTVALAGIIESSAYLGFGPFDKSVPPLSTGIIKMFGAVVSVERLIVGLSSFALVCLLFVLLNRTKLGRAMRAVVQDEIAASLQGIRPETIFIFGMFISSGLVGIAGGLMAPVAGVSPSAGHEPLIMAFVVMILGGLGSVQGSLLAAFIIGFITSFGSTYLGGQVAHLLTWAILILVLVFKPRGLIPVD